MKMTTMHDIHIEHFWDTLKTKVMKVNKSLKKTRIRNETKMNAKAVIFSLSCMLIAILFIETGYLKVLKLFL